MGSVLFLCMWISEYPKTIIEKTVFSPLSILGTLSKYYSWLCFWALRSVPLVYMSVFMTVPYGFEAFNCSIYFGVRKGVASCLIVSQDFFVYLESLVVSASLTTLKPLTEWIITDCGKFLKRWEYQTTLPASWEICMQIKKQQLELDIEQQTGSKSGKEYVKAVYCHPAYLTYMHSTSCEMPGWMKHKLESRLPGELSITSETQMTSPLWQKVKKN